MALSLKFVRRSMKRGVDISPELFPRIHKRLKVSIDGKCHNETTTPKKTITPKVVDFSDTYVLDGLNSGKFGSVTKDMEGLLAMSRQRTLTPSFEGKKNHVKQASKFANKETAHLVREIVFVDLEDENVANETRTIPLPVITIDLDEEERKAHRPSYHPREDDVLNQPSGETVMKDTGDESVADETRTTPFPVIIIDSDMEDIEDHRQSYPRENDVSNLPSGETFLKDIAVTEDAYSRTCDTSLCGEIAPEIKKDKGVDLGVEDIGVRDHSDSIACVEETSPFEEIDSKINKDKGDYLGIEDEDNHQTGTEHIDGLQDVYRANSADCVEDAILNGKIESDAEDNEAQTSPRQNDTFLNQPTGKNLKDTGIRDHSDSRTGVKDASLYRETDSEIKKHKDVYVCVEDKGSHQSGAEDNNGIKDVYGADNRTCVEDASLRGKFNSDEENKGDERPSSPCQKAVMNPPSGEIFVKDIGVSYNADSRTGVEDASTYGKIDSEINKDKGIYLGIEDEDNHESSTEEDGLEDVWNEMSMALELTKDAAIDHSSDEQVTEVGENCEHSFVLKDDLGYVCRVCGVVGKGIETIFEFQYNKVKRSTRTYMLESQDVKDKSAEIVKLNLSEDNLMLTKLHAHPSHLEKMKSHQVDGFSFLVSNLMGDNPGGCILAHAPGSGKTFMIISFLQSFLVKYPNARPLVVLPKGIMETWKKEFRIWQIENIPLYDIYKAKGNRLQQLEVLKEWAQKKSILFLGYQQFSSIVCNKENNKASTLCCDMLLKVPSILILDEGHTPRNDDTDVFQALAQVQTARKVVLSGTLYQNHVNEVFNVLNLVRPRFLSTERSRSIVKRIMSKVDMSGVRRFSKTSGDAAFFELVEDTLQKDTDFRSKVICDLREMTNKVLHYYKGDFLDELPGLIDFTVLLNLSSKQKHEVETIKKLPSKFKASSVGSAVYLHPKLQQFADNLTASDDKMDEILENLDMEDGVKAKFFLNMLNLCESKKEKLLVFSQYLVPLKFLERLAVKEKGWHLGREIFVISGDSKQGHREWSMEHFNNSPHAKVFFGSIKACGEGISLVGASRILILDVHLNPSVTRQAIGRAFRPGQQKRVVVYRLVAADSPEVEDYETCSRKESISKRWFKWKEYSGFQDFYVKNVDVDKCGDEFLESSQRLAEDVKVLYRR